MAGRTDLRGAVRLSIYLCVAGAISTLASSTPSMGGAFVNSVAGLLIFQSCETFVFTVALYLTLEPVLRRTWPESLVSWIRLLDGRLLDPRVGRDVMSGLLWGLGVAVLVVTVQWRWGLTGLPQPAGTRWDDAATQTDVLSLGGWPWANLANWALIAANFGMICTAVLALVTRLTGKRWLGVAAAVFMCLQWLLGVPEGPFSWVQALVPTLAFVTLFLRRGVLTVVVAFFTMSVTRTFPFEPPWGSWYWSATSVTAGALVALAAWSFVSMFGGRPVFSLPEERGAPVPVGAATLDSQQETAPT